MEDTKACLFSYALDGQGGAQPVELHNVAHDDARFIWIHLNGRHGQTRKFLKDQMHLDQLLIKAMLAEETRPRLEEFDTGALLILRGINFNPGPDPEDLVSTRLWISGTRIISVGRRKSRAIADLKDRIAQGRAPKRMGEFIATLCTLINDGIEPALQELEATIDSLEDSSLDTGAPLVRTPDAGLRRDLADLRKQATQFRRHIAPQRDVIHRLETLDYPWMTAADRWQMQDNYDRVTRFLENLDALRERSQILQEEFHAALSTRLNTNLYVLSVITVIFMPLTFITGLLGMNVEGIPGAHHPYAFFVVCGLTALIALALILFFRKRKWF